METEELLKNYRREKSERLQRSRELREFLSTMEPYTISYQSAIQKWYEMDPQFEEVDVIGKKFVLNDDLAYARLFLDGGQVLFQSITSVDFEMVYETIKMFKITLVCKDGFGPEAEKEYWLYGMGDTSYA